MVSKAAFGFSLKTKLTLALLASASYVLLGFVLSPPKAKAIITSDGGAASMLDNACATTTLSSTRRTYHIVYLDGVTQNNDQISFYVKARSLRCATASGSVSGVSNTVTSFALAPGALGTYYTGLTLSPGQYTGVYWTGLHNVTFASPGWQTITYSFSVTSGGTSNSATFSDQVFVNDLCGNIAGLQYPNPPPGQFADGSGNCFPDQCVNLVGVQFTVPAGYLRDGAGNCYRNASGSITSANCLRVTGNATDLDWPSGGLRIHIRTDSPYPTKPARDAEVFTDATGNWSWTVPSDHAYKSSWSSHSVWVDILGKNNSGAEDYWVAASNTGGVSFGPCQSAACSSITLIVAGQPNQTIPYGGAGTMPIGSTFTVRMGVLNNAPNPGGTTWLLSSSNAGEYSFGTANNNQFNTLNTFEPGADPRLASPGPSPVGLGGVGFFDYTRTATGGPTTYQFQFRMVRNYNEWFRFGDCRFNLQTTNPPPRISCTLLPGSVIVGFQLTPQVNIIGATTNTADITISSITVTYNPGAIVSSNPTGAGVPAIPPGGTGYTTPSSGAGSLPAVTLPSGTYTVSASVAGSSGTSASCLGTATSGSRPVIKTSGGDVWSGGVFAKGTDPSQTCSAPSPGPQGRILGFSVNSPTFMGSNGNLAAYARGIINGYFTNGSAQAQAALPPPGASLSFANVAPVSTTFPDAGGNFSSAINCINDFYATSIKTPVTIGAGSYSLATLDGFAGDQVQILSGNVTITGGANFAGKVAVFITGNAYISGNITLNQNYSSRGNIPFFGLFVRGNVYISPAVTTVEGVYSVQPQLSDPSNPLASTFTANTGTLYTCTRAANPFTAVVEDASGPSELISAGCGTNALNFNGVVTAKRIKLLRTTGNITSGYAESFNVLPELYLVPDPPVNTPESLYDAAATLPPVL